MKETLIDVREYPEFAAGHIEGSRLVPLGSLDQESESWDRTAPLILICKSGRRAEQARQQLALKGFIALSILEGGVEGWRTANRPLLTTVRCP